MSIDLSVFATDEAAITAELPATMIFQDGQSVVGMVGDSRFSQDLVMDGFQGNSDVEFRGRVSLFTTMPNLNTKCTHKESGLQYRISTRNLAPDGITYVFGLVNLTK